MVPEEPHSITRDRNLNLKMHAMQGREDERMAGQTAAGNSKRRRFSEGTPLLAGGGAPIVGIGETSLRSCRGRECTDYVRDGSSHQ